MFRDDRFQRASLGVFWMEDVESEAAANASNANEWLKFKLASEYYAVNVVYVKEILGSCDITPVPGAFSFILGIINLRGNIVPVADARRLLGLEASAAADERGWTLILDPEGEVAGLVVDEVLDILTFENSAIQRLNESDHGYLSGVVEVDGEMLILLDAKGIAGCDRQTGSEAA